MTDKQGGDFKAAVESSGALEFIQSLEASEVDVEYFEVKQHQTGIVVTCTPKEEEISEELQTIAAEHGFKQNMDAPS